MRKSRIVLYPFSFIDYNIATIVHYYAQQIMLLNKSKSVKDFSAVWRYGSTSGSMSLFWQGLTRLMLTRVPFFKELIIGSFECKHCGHKDSEISSAGRIQEKGIKLILQVSSTDVSFLFTLVALGFLVPQQWSFWNWKSHQLLHGTTLQLFQLLFAYADVGL